jgi:hypothetical protein
MSDSELEVLQCQICQELCDDADILCPNFHSYCPDCLNTSLQTDLIDNKKIDKACMICKEKYYEEKFETMLWEDTRLMLLKRNIFECFNIPSGLYLLNCPTCEKNKEAAILIDRDDYIQYYECEVCKKLSCLYCRTQTTARNHIKCQKLLNVCKDLEKVIELGVSHSCSKCKRREVSDYTIPNLKAGCCHITCKSCNMASCYICGIHQEDVDKAFASATLSGHHNDWKTNIKRCPMYIKSFKDIIPNFPENEDEASVYFRNYKIKAFTKKVIDKHGHQKVKDAFDVFKEKRLANLKDENFINYDYTGYQAHEAIDNKIFNRFKI